MDYWGELSPVLLIKNADRTEFLHFAEEWNQIK